MLNSGPKSAEGAFAESPLDEEPEQRVAVVLLDDLSQPSGSADEVDEWLHRAWKNRRAPCPARRATGKSKLPR